MSIRKFYEVRGAIIRLTILPLVLFLLDVSHVAVARPQERPQVRNVNLEIKQDIAIITYDLQAPPDESYEISAALIKEGEPAFRIVLKSATGDIGKGKFAGTRRQILWEWRKDLPKDFKGGLEYAVEVSATRIEAGGGGSWVYYVLGGALIAGGVVVLAGGKSGSKDATSALPSSPPGRPF